MRSVPATIDAQGQVHLLEPIALSGTHRAIVTILDGENEPQSPETALLSEPALAKDWNRPEEDAAWAYLQPGQ